MEPAEKSETLQDPVNLTCASRAWKAPTLMLFDVKGHTSSFENPAPNNDSSTVYFTAS